MEKIKNRIISFMYGRSGPDSLYKASMYLCMGLMLINIFAHSAVIFVISWALLIWSVFRALSKNIYKRQQENIRFLQLADKVRKKLGIMKTMLTDKEHSYKKCPKCKTVLRLPRKQGDHTVSCPKCHEDFKIKIR